MSVEQISIPYPEAVVLTDPSHSQAARPRFEFLDGLRGYAALYVVLFHLYLDAINRVDERTLPWSAQSLLLSLKQGRYAVDVFIVLSGFCLMLPVLSSSESKLPGGLGDYVKRRARRILPPYYAALAFCLGMIALFPDLNRLHGVHWDLMLPAFTFKAVLSHLLLLHNLTYSTIYKINGSMWSVATEWQIYFIFPLLLLPLWRRYGHWASVSAGFLLGFALGLLSSGRFDPASPWYIGLFALGMAGADVGMHANKMQIWRLCVSWVVASLLCGVLLFCIHYKSHDQAIADVLVGLAATALMIYCTRIKRSTGSASSAVLKFFESRPAQLLGLFSYSIYLTHRPILALYDLQARKLHWGFITQIGIGCLTALPVVLGIGYLFHLAAERPVWLKAVRSILQRPGIEP